MNRKSVFAIFLAVLTVGSVFAMPALAANLTQVDGSTVSSTDQVNNVVLTEGGSVENVTVDFTEDQNPSAGGSVTYQTNVTAASASVAAGTDTGNLSVTINDDNITVTDTTGADSDEVISTLNVTFNVSETGNSSGSVSDFINVSEATAPNETLMEDPDASEVMNYTVVDRYAEADLSVKGVDASFNRSGGDFEVNETGQGQIVIDLTRNNTTYENLSAETVRVQVALNNTAFSDISEQTDEQADYITLADKEIQDGETVYTWAISQPDNTTRDYTVKVNATVNGGDYNDSVSVNEVHDPVGGTQDTYTESYDHDSLSGAAPNFPSGPLGLPLWMWGIGIVGLGFAFYSLYGGKDNPSRMNGRMPRAKAYAFGTGWQMVVWVIVFVAGLTMVFDGLLPNGLIGVQFDFWTNLLGVGDMMALIVGFLLMLATGAINLRGGVR